MDGDVLLAGDYQSSENILNPLQSKKKFPEKLDRDLHFNIGGPLLKTKFVF